MIKKIIVLLTLVITFALPTVSFAANIKTGQDIFIDTPDKDLYAFGSNVNVNANVLGDLTAFGASIIVDKNVEDSLFLAGGTAKLKGIIGRHLRAMSGNISLDNQIGGDALIFGGSATTSSQTTIAGDLIFGGGSLTFNGATAGYSRLNAGTVTINGTMAGNVDIHAQEVVIGEKAVIAGKLTYWSENEAKIASGAQLNGGMKYNKTKPKPVGISALGTKSGLWSFFIGLVSLAVLTVIMLYLLPKHTQKATEVGISSPFAAFWTGLAMIILVPIVILLLLISSIGALSGLSLMFLYIGALIISYGLAAIWTGSLIFKLARKEKEVKVGVWPAIVGAVVLVLVGLIPIIGPLLKIIVFLIALGTIGQLIREFYQRTKPVHK